MNVFYCDEDPHRAAIALADRHVVKMCLEAAQILSTAARAASGDEAADALGLYRATHKAHPVTVEVVRCEHYRGWVYRWAHALGAEYRRRYGRAHKSAAVATAAASLLAIDGLALDAYPAPWDVPQCMPEEHRGDDPVMAYRGYLRAKYAEWGDRARWTLRVSADDAGWARAAAALGGILLGPGGARWRLDAVGRTGGERYVWMTSDDADKVVSMMPFDALDGYRHVMPGPAWVRAEVADGE